jgi:hypothetical protein
MPGIDLLLQREQLFSPILAALEEFDSKQWRGGSSFLSQKGIPPAQSRATSVERSIRSGGSVAPGGVGTEFKLREMLQASPGLAKAVVGPR